MERTERFMPYHPESRKREKEEQIKGYWKTSCTIFFKNKTGVFAAALLILMVLFCLFGQYLRPFSVQEQNTAIKNMAPSAQDWFGTDQLGRDLFVRVCKGGQVSILIGLLASVIVSVVGLIYGSISGYMGGRTDLIMMRIVEVFKGGASYCNCHPVQYYSGCRWNPSADLGVDGVRMGKYGTDYPGTGYAATQSGVHSCG